MGERDLRYNTGRICESIDYVYQSFLGGNCASNNQRDLQGTLCKNVDVTCQSTSVL